MSEIKILNKCERFGHVSVGSLHAFEGEIARLDSGKSLFFDHHTPEVVRMFLDWR